MPCEEFPYQPHLGHKGSECRTLDFWRALEGLGELTDNRIELFFHCIEPPWETFYYCAVFTSLGLGPLQFNLSLVDSDPGRGQDQEANKYCHCNGWGPVPLAIGNHVRCTEEQ